jgi:Na+-driven multidrug efflux pump
MTTEEVATETQPLVSKKNVSIDEDDDPSFTSQNKNPSLAEDALDTIKLGIPIFIARLSFVGVSKRYMLAGSKNGMLLSQSFHFRGTIQMKTTDTALLGHVSREALSASALSDLWTMCTQVIMNGRILGVLVGGAIGAGNPKLAGIYLQVSYVVLASMSVVVFIAWNLTEQVWLAFGSDPEISHMAGYYARVLSFAIPGILGFGQLSQFFSAQRIMHPEVNSASIGLILNLVLGFIFVLGWPIPAFRGYQFAACPIVTACMTYIQLAIILIVYVHFQKLHLPAWGGLNRSEITWTRIKTFCELYFPAAMSSASDFWRVAVIGTIAAKLGEEEVAVFNTSYR